MAQAQFVGPTSAELGNQSLAAFMQGMQGLAQFGQFATEQNRLNKIEEIKGKASALDLLMKHYGGPKALAEKDPGVLTDFFTRVGYSPEMARNTVDLMARDDASAQELLPVLQKFMIQTEPAGGAAGEAGAAAAPAAEPAAVAPSPSPAPAPAAAPVGQPATTAEQASAGARGRQAKPANLMSWDQAAAGELGSEAQQAWHVIMTLQDKYAAKNKSAPGAWAPQEQNMGWEKSRKMYFTPFLADEHLKNPQGASKLQARGSNPGALPITPLMTNQERGEILKDKAIFQHNLSVLNQARYSRGQALAGQGAVDAQGRAYAALPPQVLYGGMTAGNRTAPMAGGPLTEPVSQQAAQPAAVPAAAPGPPPGVPPFIQPAPALTAGLQQANTAGAKVAAGSADPKDKRQLESLVSKLKGQVTISNVERLARSDPAYARAIAVEKTNDKNLMALMAMAADPNKHEEFAMDVASGKYQASIDYLEGTAQAAVLNAQTLAATAGAEIQAKLAQAAASVEQAHAAVIASADNVKIGKLQLQREGLMLEIAKATSNMKEFEPIKTFADQYKVASDNLGKFLISKYDPKTKKMVMSATDLSAINLLIDARNASAQVYGDKAAEFYAAQGKPFSGAPQEMPHWTAKKTGVWILAPGVLGIFGEDVYGPEELTAPIAPAAPAAAAAPAGKPAALNPAAAEAASAGY